MHCEDVKRCLTLVGLRRQDGLPQRLLRDTGWRDDSQQIAEDDARPVMQCEPMNGRPKRAILHFPQVAEEGVGLHAPRLELAGKKGQILHAGGDQQRVTF